MGLGLSLTEWIPSLLAPKSEARMLPGHHGPAEVQKLISSSAPLPGERAPVLQLLSDLPGEPQ